MTQLTVKDSIWLNNKPIDTTISQTIDNVGFCGVSGELKIENNIIVFKPICYLLYMDIKYIDGKYYYDKMIDILERNLKNLFTKEGNIYYNETYKLEMRKTKKNYLIIIERRIKMKMELSELEFTCPFCEKHKITYVETDKLRDFMNREKLIDDIFPNYDTTYNNILKKRVCSTCQAHQEEEEEQSELQETIFDISDNSSNSECEYLKTKIINMIEKCQRI